MEQRDKKPQNAMLRAGLAEETLHAGTARGGLSNPHFRQKQVVPELRKGGRP